VPRLHLLRRLRTHHPSTIVPTVRDLETLFSPFVSGAARALRRENLSSSRNAPSRREGAFL
jgi:hypothetical protein